MKELKRREIDTTQRGGLEGCVQPLLNAMQWHGSARQVTEALPHYEHLYSIFAFCEVMAHLKYSYETVRIQLDQVDSRLLPCLYGSDNGTVMVLISKSETEIIAYDSEANAEIVLSRSGLTPEINTGTAYLFRPVSDQQTGRRRTVRSSWVYKILENNKSIIYQGLLLSLILALLALATPLYTMFVYDSVIGTASLAMLAQFVVGIALVYVGIYIVHQLRGKLIAMLGARLDHDVGNNIFQRLLYLAPVCTESANVGSQVARVRDFDRLRDFLTGPLLTIIFEIPFIVISLGIIAILGGSLVFVPVGMIAVFTLLFILLQPKVSYRIAKSAEKGARLQEFLLEAVSNMKVLKYTAAEATWLSRYRELSANATMSSLQLTMVGAINNAVSNAIMIGSGLAIIGFGAIKIVNNQMTVGAMIAIMMLIWRVLGPLRSVYNTLPRLIQIAASLKQIHRLMEIQTEVEPGDEVLIRPQHFKGNITFDRVSFRYSTSYNPALMGVTFDIKPGMVVGLVGRNGSGKSTVLKLVLGLYQPQAGSVRIDNQDIRQVNPLELRKSIAYLPQTPELFYGSIAANLRLADPTATEEMMCTAAEKAGILEDILALPAGFETQIRDHSKARLASSFQQGLCLARAYLKKTAIMLLDEPTNVLDAKADNSLMKAIDEFRGHTTILMVTHRPSHLKRMDWVLLFDQGQMLIQGPPDAVLSKIPQDFL